MTDALAGEIAARLTAFGADAAYTIVKRVGKDRVAELSGTRLLADALARAEAWKAGLGLSAPRVLLVLPPGEEFLVSLYAGLLGGCIVIPAAQPRAGAQTDRFRHIVSDCGADLVLGTGQTCAAILRHMTDEGRIPPACPIGYMDAEGALRIVDGKARDGAPLGADPGLALIQYTSGSTRFPKGVRIGGSQIIANARMLGEAWSVSDPRRYVNWCPPYHDLGLMGGILYPLLLSANAVQMSPLDVIRRPAMWLEAISTYRGTASGGPAFMFEQCLERISDEEIDGLDLASWETAFCGAEPVPATLLSRFADRFAGIGLRREALFAAYGMAENCVLVAGQHAPAGGAEPTASHGNTYPCRLSATTRPFLKVVDPETLTEQPEGKPGEIWIRGPSKAGGYVNLPEETEQSFHATLAGENPGGEGWLRSGDLGVIEGDWLYITARLKDTLIVNGRNVGATEVEWLAASVDEALNPFGAAAFPIDLTRGAEAALLIELKPGAEAPDDLDAVCTAMRRAVASEFGITLREIRLLRRGTLERTSSGKIRRLATAAAFRKGEGPGAEETLMSSSDRQTEPA